MIYIVDVSRTLRELGKMLVEASGEAEALTKAQDVLNEAEDEYVRWDGEYQERTDEPAGVERAYPSSDDPYFMNMTINGEPAKPVLQDNGTYLLE